MFTSKKRELLGNPYPPVSPQAPSSRDVRELAQAVERNSDLLADLLMVAGLVGLVAVDYLMTGGTFRATHV
jgi:hypothetical protein